MVQWLNLPKLAPQNTTSRSSPDDPALPRAAACSGTSHVLVGILGLIWVVNSKWIDLCQPRGDCCGPPQIPLGLVSTGPSRSLGCVLEGVNLGFISGHSNSTRISCNVQHSWASRTGKPVHSRCFQPFFPHVWKAPLLILCHLLLLCAFFLPKWANISSNYFRSSWLQWYLIAENSLDQTC